MAEYVSSWIADAVDAWILKWVLAELAEDDRALARFEDEGGPPEVEVCGAVHWYYGCTCDRPMGHTGAHEGDASRPGSALGRCRWIVVEKPCLTCGGPCAYLGPVDYRRRGSYTGSAGF